MSRMLMRFVNRSPSNPSTSWEPRPRTSLPIAMANSVPTRMARRVQFGPSARERITSSMMSFPIQRLATGTKTRTTRSTAVGKVSARSVRQTRTSSAGTYRIAANRSRQVSLSGVPLREAIEGSYQLSAVSYQGNCLSSRGAQRRGICTWVAWRNSGGVWLRAGEGRQGGKCRSLATLGMTSSADSDGLVAYRPMLRRSLTTLPLVFILYFSPPGGASTPRRRLPPREAGARSWAGAGTAHSAPRAAGVLGSRGAHRRGAREHAAARGRILPLGAARVRAILGLSERLAHVDVLARRHGDLPGAVQPVSGVLRSLVRRRRALGGVAARHLERDGDQRPRCAPRRTHLHHRRYLHHPRLSRYRGIGAPADRPSP